MTVPPPAPDKMTAHSENPNAHRALGVGIDAGEQFSRWWQAGGPLWAIGLGTLTLFVWLPVLRLVSTGLGQGGEHAWQGLVQAWPHPAMLGWAEHLDQWASGLVSDGAFLAEGWLVGALLLAGLFALAQLPTHIVWHRNRQRNPLVTRIASACSMALFIAVPLSAGWVWNTLAAAPTGAKLIAALLLLSLGCGMQFALQRASMSKIRNWRTLAFGSVVSVLAPLAILALAYQVVWLGALATLPLVQLSLLLFMFSGAWTSHHIGVFWAASGGNQRSAFDDLASASRGQLAALALDCLRVVERKTSLRHGVSFKEVAGELDLHVDDSAVIFAKLAEAGVVETWFARNGQPQVSWAVDVSVLSVFDVARVFGAPLEVTSGLSNRAAEGCLSQAATIERQTLDISLLDLFYHRGSALHHLAQSPLINLAPHQVAAATQQRAANGQSEHATALERELELERQPKQAASFGPLQFEDPFWQDAELDEALQGLNNRPTMANELASKPEPLKRAS